MSCFARALLLSVWILMCAGIAANAAPLRYARLLNHLVGDREQRRWHFEAEPWRS
jgi:hypothetical protein